MEQTSLAFSGFIKSLAITMQYQYELSWSKNHGLFQPFLVMPKLRRASITFRVKAAAAVPLASDTSLMMLNNNKVKYTGITKLLTF